MSTELDAQMEQSIEEIDKQLQALQEEINTLVVKKKRLEDQKARVSNLLENTQADRRSLIHPFPDQSTEVPPQVIRIVSPGLGTR